MAATFATRAVDVKAEAQAALLDGGVLELYSGVRPATVDTAIRGRVPLARLLFDDPAFDAAQDGVVRARPLQSDAFAAATGRATWFRASGADGAAVCDGAIGTTAEADLVLTRVTIEIGSLVSVESFTMTEPKRHG